MGLKHRPLIVRVEKEVKDRPESENAGRLEEDVQLRRSIMVPKEPGTCQSQKKGVEVNRKGNNRCDEMLRM